MHGCICCEGRENAFRYLLTRISGMSFPVYEKKGEKRRDREREREKEEENRSLIRKLLNMR